MNTYNTVLWFSSNKVDEPRPCYTEGSNSERRKTNIIYSCTYMESKKKNGFGEPISREGMEMQSSRTDLWTQWGKERMRQMEKGSATYVSYRV